MDSSYDLGVLNWRATLFAAGVLLIPALIAWAALKFSGGTKAMALVAIIAMLVFPWVLLLVVQMFAVSARIHQGQLLVGGGLYKERIPLRDVEVDRVTILDTNSGPYALTYRKNGIGMPGLALGWFKTRAGREAFAALSRRKRVVLVPISSGYDVILSPTNPDAFVEDLRRAVDRGRTN